MDSRAARSGRGSYERVQLLFGSRTKERSSRWTVRVERCAGRSSSRYAGGKPGRREGRVGLPRLDRPDAAQFRASGRKPESVPAGDNLQNCHLVTIK